MPSVFQAQSLTEITMQQANLSSEEAARFSTQSAKPEALNTKLVTVADPGNGAGTVTFTLPGHVGTLQAEPIITNYKNSEDYQRSYRFTNALGYAILARYNGQVIGRISVGGQVWVLAPVASGIAALGQLNPAFSIGACGSEGGEEEMPSLACEPEEDCLAYVDILVLFAQDFDNNLLDGNGNVVNFWGAFHRLVIVKYFELEINTIIRNSQVPNKFVRCGSNPIGSFSFTFTPYIADDVATLIASSAALRDLSGADLVCLVRADGKFWTGGGPIGAASVPAMTGVCSSIGSTCFASVINARYSFGPTLLFSHENGHNLGLRHQIAVDPGGNCNHAYVYTGNSGATQRTTMEALSPTVIPHFSNPEVVFDGQPTGVQEADNARKLTSTACIVSQFRAGGLSATINGSNSPHCDSDPPFQLTSTIQEPNPVWGYPGLPPYFSTWRRSQNPDMSGAVSAGSGSSITIDPSTLGTGTWWFELTVQSLTDYSTFIAPLKSVKIVADCFGGGDDRSSVGKEAHDVFFEVAPNPASDHVEMRVIGSSITSGTISVWSYQGQRIIQKQVFGQNFTEIWDVFNIPNGLYFVCFEQDGAKHIRKLLLLKD